MNAPLPLWPPQLQRDGVSTLLSLFSSCALRADSGLTFLLSQAWGPRSPGTRWDPEPAPNWMATTESQGSGFPVGLASEGKVLFFLSLSLFCVCDKTAITKVRRKKIN